MRKLAKTLLTSCLIVIMLFSTPLALASCSQKKNVVMEYNGVELTSDIYEYWMSQYKALMLYYYGYTDSVSFWLSDREDGQTYEEFVTEQIDKYIMNRLICIYLFDSLGFTLTTDERKDVNDRLDSLVSSLAEGSKSKFNEFAAKYGIDYAGVKNALLYEAKVAKAYSSIYSSGGLYTLTDSDKDSYYEENYSRIKVILIRTKNKFVTDENGNYIVSSDGKTYETTGLTEAEREAKYELISTITASLESGESFESLLSYSDDPSTSDYANGFYFTRSTSYIDGIVDAAFSLEVGEWCAVTSEYGTHFVMRYELDEGAYDNKANEDFFDDFEESVYSAVFAADMKELYSDITVYTEEKEKIKLREVKSNWEM